MGLAPSCGARPSYERATTHIERAAPRIVDAIDWSGSRCGRRAGTPTRSCAACAGTPSSRPVSIYFAAVPLESGKTVKSVTLPTVGSGAGNGVNAMHIFAIAVGSGTSTSGGSSAMARFAGRGERGEAHYAGRR